MSQADSNQKRAAAKEKRRLSEPQLRSLRWQVILASVVAALLFSTGVAWQATTPHLMVYPYLLLAVGVMVLTLASARVIRIVHVTPAVTPLLLLGGGLLALSIALNVVAVVQRTQYGETNVWVERTLVAAGWGGVGFLVASFYIALVEAAIARARLLNEREQLEVEVQQRRETEEALRHARDELENRVQQRTAELRQEVQRHSETAQTLRASEQRFQHITATAGDWIWELDADGKYSFSSLAVQDLLGYAPEEIQGRHYLDFVVRRIHDDASGLLPDGAADGEAPVCQETWKQHKDGHEVLHESTIIPLVEAGNIVGYRGSSRDITTQRLLEEQLERSRKMEALGQLASAVAHDFNNLITVIVGCAQKVRDTLPAEHEARSILEVVDEAAEQATGMTRSLLLFGREHLLEKSTLELGDAVRNATRLIRRLIPAAIDFEVQTDEGREIWVNADSTQLQEILLNLAINARDAMPSGGRLTISVDRLAASEVDAEGSQTAADDVARLQVQDTGEGIQPEVLERIFEPFFTTKTRGHGTGLGLAIVDSIVKNHQGWMEVDSQVNQGTTFRIYFPCAAPLERVPAAAEKQQTERGDGEMILLAEDNRLVRGLITSQLSSQGYHVEGALDGDELMEKFEARSGQVRLLILDIDLPKRSGLACLQGIRKSHAEIPAILITGHAEHDLEEQIDGATRFLRKPFQPNALAECVRELLNSRRAEEAAT